LSKQEGIPPEQWCYETNPQGKVTKLAPNYLHQTGYRLPTEAEWEYACRAQAVTSRHYGETEELLGKYDWYLHNAENHSWPVGSLKPNDFGFFDMHGNVWNWCQERYKPYAMSKDGKAIEDSEDGLIVNADSRVFRGGAFTHLAVSASSAHRSRNGPGFRLFLIGFRPARTFPAE
jgi:formylglycine-generating enzyme required for sulfatase activity